MSMSIYLRGYRQDPRILAPEFQNSISLHVSSSDTKNELFSFSRNLTVMSYGLDYDIVFTCKKLGMVLWLKLS